MKLYSGILALALLATVSFSSCSKNKDILTVNKDNLAGTYVISSITVKENSNAEEDATEAYFEEPCEIDDEYVLKANGSFDRIDAGTSCTPSGTLTGDTWFLEDGKTIGFDQYYGDVTKLTTTEMTVKLVMTYGSDTVTVYFNFIRK
jgi:hypothetical protein